MTSSSLPLLAPASSFEFRREALLAALALPMAVIPALTLYVLALGNFTAIGTGHGNWVSDLFAFAMLALLTVVVSPITATLSYVLTLKAGGASLPRRGWWPIPIITFVAAVAVAVVTLGFHPAAEGALLLLGALLANAAALLVRRRALRS